MPSTSDRRVKDRLAILDVVVKRIFGMIEWNFVWNQTCIDFSESLTGFRFRQCTTCYKGLTIGLTLVDQEVHHNCTSTTYCNFFSNKVSFSFSCAIFECIEESEWAKIARQKCCVIFDVIGQEIYGCVCHAIHK